MKNPPDMENPFIAIQKLAADLRDPDGGCPWDREQTHVSLIENLIEEAYETAQAIEELSGNDPETWSEFKEELGDLLFQVVIHSQMASEKKYFNLEDVFVKTVEKLVFRHPHVYGEEKGVENSREVLENWESLKRKEKWDKKKKGASLFSGIPEHLPALLKSCRMGQKASRLNFDWRYPDGAEQLFDKISEEYDELMRELPENPEDFHNCTEKKLLDQKRRATLEFGDLLFVVAQLARHFHIDPEYALQQSNKKFQSRFLHMEKEFKSKLDDGILPSTEEWENAWQNAKRKEKS
ncbi:MAG: nucleoside triphosphate pyrophosphohydrolase [Spirochaetia bacterium]|nr:nucleoside triphosphate pyrophosphohydrolase [Spirochaetia bacterium]